MECLKKKCLISVVVPLYKGKKYVNKIVRQIEAALKYANIEKNSEIIFVNDYPEEEIITPKSDIKNVLVINKFNKGIHYSRVKGLKESSGEYIHFLDQDDKIKKNFYKAQLNKIKNCDVIVSNGIIEMGDNRKILYKRGFERLNIKNPYAYIILDNRITSPGQCIIKRASIPSVWCSETLRYNGADDLYLWLTMFENRKKFKTNKDILYLHKYTKENTSLNDEIMNKSMKEFSELYNKYYPQGKYTTLVNAKINYITKENKTFSSMILSLLYEIRLFVFKIRMKL